MTNKEKAIEIFRLLEENHINLYHDISKEDFQEELNKFLEIAEDLDDVHFDAGICKLFALFKDAHTSYFIKSDFVDAQIKVVDDKYYICDIKNNLCEEISKVNGFDIKVISERLKELIPFECESWAKKCIADRLCCLKHLRMIDCENKDNLFEIEYHLANGDIFTSKLGNRKKQNKPNYSFSVNHDIIVVNYLKCKNMDEYPFIQFVQDIKTNCKKLPKACIVDLRGNTGGSSEIIWPLIDWLKENSVDTYVLMNEQVFSSGIFALFYLKKYLDAKFIGTEAGQGGCRYGQQKQLEVDGKSFGCSEKKFDFTNKCDERLKKYFSKNHAIVPDIYLPEKIEDVALGIDGQLRDALEIIEKEIEISKEIL